MLGVGLALIASVAWGVGDFIGGLKTRVMPVLSVLVISQVVGFVWIAGVALIAQKPMPHTCPLPPARALVTIVGSLYPVVTVLLARIVLRERVARVQEAGVVAALGGVVLIAAG